MGKAEPTYLKTVEAIPAALGIKYPKQANRRARIREQIIVWTARADFPKKTRHGWRRAEAIRWGEDRGLKIEDGKIIRDPSSILHPPSSSKAKANGDLPAQAEPNNGELFMSVAERLKARLDHLEDLYLNPFNHEKKIVRHEIEELRIHRPHLFEDVKASGEVGSSRGDDRTAQRAVPTTARVNDASDLCDNLTAIASKMDFHYRNPDGSSRLQFEIDAKAVSDWKKGRRLDGAPGPPGKANSRQWSARQWIEWFDAHFWLKWKKASTPQTEAFGDADLRRMQLAEEFKKLEDAQRERDIRDLKYRPVEEFDRCFTLLGAQLNRFITEHGEKNLARGAESAIKALGLPATVELPALEAVRAGCRGAADALRAELERELVEIKPEAATGG